MRKHALVLCGALVGVAVIAAPASAATTTTSPARRTPSTVGSIGLRLVDVPASARDDPRAEIYIVDHLAPGTMIHRRIEVSNATASDAHVVLYAAAATIADGLFLGDAGHNPNDLSTWTSVRPGASDIPAGGDLTATVTINIPYNATPGEQYAVVWAEVRASPVAGQGVTEVSRVGIRLYVSVGSGGAAASNFAIESLTAERSPNGRPTVLAAVHNTGGRALDMSGTLKLSNGPGRLSAGPFPATLGVTLAIGDTEPVTIALDRQLPAGPWDAQITLHSGLIERTARATITFPEAGASSPVNTASQGRRWPAVAAGYLVAGLAVIAALLLILVPRRRRAAYIAAFGNTRPTESRSARELLKATRNGARSAAVPAAARVQPTRRSPRLVSRVTKR